MATLSEARAHRRDVAELTRLANDDLRLIWRSFAGADETRDGLIEVLPRLVDMYGSAAATLGADWYDDMRGQAGVKGRFRAITAVLPGADRTDALARWGVSPLFSDEPDVVTAMSKVGGGLQRIIADADRGSIIDSLDQDPQGKGWQRITAGGCDFCVMLAERGDVYSAETADFASHDWCHCSAVPVYSDDPRPVKEYTPSQKFKTQEARDANNKGVREYLNA